MVCFVLRCWYAWKVLQDRYIASEGVIRRLRMRQDIQSKEMDRYKEDIRTLNKELTTVTEKLQQESNLQGKAQKDKDS